MQRAVLGRIKMAHWGSHTALLVAAVLLVAVPARGEDPKTNLDVMRGLTTEAIDEVLAKWGSKVDARGVQLKPYANNEQYVFITTLLTTMLTDRGIKTYQAGTEDSGAIVLEYQALRFNLSYPRVYRSWLIGGKKVERRAEIELLTTIVDPDDGSVVSVGQSVRDHKDNFPYKQVGRVEEGNFQFTRPPVPSSGWGKYVEPVFVSGIIVGLIYLFFSNQSDN